jgi:hypothetical protein
MIAASPTRERTDRGVGEETVTPLRLAGPLQRPVNRGQGARGMDERDTAQGEPGCGAAIRRADTRERAGALSRSAR